MLADAECVRFSRPPAARLSRLAEVRLATTGATRCGMRLCRIRAATFASRPGGRQPAGVQDPSGPRAVHLGGARGAPSSAEPAGRGSQEGRVRLTVGTRRPASWCATARRRSPALEALALKARPASVTITSSMRELLATPSRLEAERSSSRLRVASVRLRTQAMRSGACVHAARGRIMAPPVPPLCIAVYAMRNMKRMKPAIWVQTFMVSLCQRKSDLRACVMVKLWRR
mmetsp:Transcript_11261/g.38392  ORF Transcript_11261/g.38392 Transcript_11261/m.38392 type:complete len:229 (-) Transcript_11261:190-876(-)